MLFQERQLKWMNIMFFYILSPLDLLRKAHCKPHFRIVIATVRHQFPADMTSGYRHDRLHTPGGKT
jgi:hypothetical protein